MKPMHIYVTEKEMRTARKQLGHPAALNEAIVATGIDAFMHLLGGGVIVIDGKRLYLKEEDT